MKLPQLHLRDLFWLMLVIGLAVGWSVERQRWIQETRKIRQRERSLYEQKVDALMRLDPPISSTEHVLRELDQEIRQLSTRDR